MSLLNSSLRSGLSSYRFPTCCYILVTVSSLSPSFYIVIIIVFNEVGKYCYSQLARDDLKRGGACVISLQLQDVWEVTQTAVSCLAVVLLPPLPSAIDWVE